MSLRDLRQGEAPAKSHFECSADGPQYGDLFNSSCSKSEDRHKHTGDKKQGHGRHKDREGQIDKVRDEPCNPSDGQKHECQRETPVGSGLASRFTAHSLTLPHAGRHQLRSQRAMSTTTLALIGRSAPSATSADVGARLLTFEEPSGQAPSPSSHTCGHKRHRGQGQYNRQEDTELPVDLALKEVVRNPLHMKYVHPLTCSSPGRGGRRAAITAVRATMVTATTIDLRWGGLNQ